MWLTLATACAQANAAAPWLVDPLAAAALAAGAVSLTATPTPVVSILPPTTLPLPTPTTEIIPPSPTPTVEPTATPISEPQTQYPFISGVTTHAREIFLKGKELGNRPNVFSKVGDSITESAVFLNPIGIQRYFLYDEYAYLEPVIQYFSTEAARANYNSFANVSMSAKTNWRARAVFSPSSANAEICNPGEAPLPCELRLVRPAIALIMLGTNDVPYTPLDEYESDMRRVIEHCLEQGVIPALSTIPHLERQGLEGRSEQLNEIIVRLAVEYDIPLWDYWSALKDLPQQGVGDDGIHPTWAPVGHSADFTPQYLQYGMTIRNLMAVQILDVIWKEVITSNQ